MFKEINTLFTTVAERFYLEVLIMLSNRKNRTNEYFIIEMTPRGSKKFLEKHDTLKSSVSSPSNFSLYSVINHQEMV